MKQEIPQLNIPVVMASFCAEKEDNLTYDDVFRMVELIEDLDGKQLGCNWNDERVYGDKWCEFKLDDRAQAYVQILNLGISIEVKNCYHENRIYELFEPKHKRGVFKSKKEELIEVIKCFCEWFINKP